MSVNVRIYMMLLTPRAHRMHLFSLNLKEKTRKKTQRASFMTDNYHLLTPELKPNQ